MPLEYSIAWLICAVICGRDEVMVGWPGALKITCFIVRLGAALAVLVFRRDLAKEAELLVLRHENGLLRRQAGGYGTSPSAELFTALTRLIPRERRAGSFP